MKKNDSYHLVGGAKTGYNLYKFMLKQGLNVVLYASENDYSHGRTEVKTVSDFLEIDAQPESIIITSESAFNLLESKYKAVFENHYYLRNKLNLPKIASQIGILSIPNYSISEVTSFPVVLKPKESMAGKVPFKFMLVNSQAVLESHKPLLGDCLIQPFFDESYKEYTIGGYFDGSANSLLSAEKINYYPKGISAFVKDKTLQNKNMINKVASYLNNISYRGFIEMEFKVKDDIWYIMDINPRPWGYFYFYLDGFKNLKEVLLHDSLVQLDLKKQWVNIPRLFIANLQGRFLNPSVKELFDGSTCYEPLFN